MQEQGRTRRNCLGTIGWTVLLGSGVGTPIALGIRSRKNFRESFVDVEKEILDIFKRYATRTPEQVQQDDSFQDWEKYNSIWREKDKIVCSSSLDGTPVGNGPYLTVTHFMDDLPRIDFWYHIRQNSYIVEFGRKLQGYEFILSRNIDNNEIVDTIRYVIDSQNEKLIRHLFRKQGRSRSLTYYPHFKDAEQIFSLVERVEDNYQTAD